MDEDDSHRRRDKFIVEASFIREKLYPLLVEIFADISTLYRSHFKYGAVCPPPQFLH